MLCTGIFWILQKIDSESSMNRNGFIFYAHLWAVVISIWAAIFTKTDFIHSFQLLPLAMIASISYFIVLRLRLSCLKFMSSSSYFINYRIFVSIILLLWGQFLFNESIVTSEYIWVFLWFIVFYLLLEQKQDKKWKENLKTGYIYLWLSILIASILWLFQKWIMIQDFDVLTYVLYSGIFWSLASLIFKWKDNLKNILTITSRKHLLFLLITALSFGIWYYFNLMALQGGWDVAVVYKIISYSLFFPIIFSILFFKEELSLKRIIAFILTIISIFLFV